MQKESASQFMLDKIEELQSALFFPETSDRILPTCVLQQVQTDKQDHIWFVIARPPYAIDPSNASFPCKMDFFKKGADFHLKVIGIASIIEEPVSSGCPLPVSMLKEAEENKTVVIRVKIQKSSYFEVPPATTDNKASYNFFHAVTSVFNQFFM
ncbi:MAG: hypothetical protein QM726_23990 [Chitinophagaceae bacterium]